MNENTTSILNWIAGWTGVFIINLPVPLIIACTPPRKMNQYGIGLGLWVLWCAGALLMAKPGRLRESLVYGGLFFTVTQGIFCFHFAIGLVAVLLFEPCVRYLPESAAPFLQGFVCTVMTGQLCILMALPIGYVVTVPAKQPVPPSPPTNDGEDTHE